MSAVGLDKVYSSTGHGGAKGKRKRMIVTSSRLTPRSRLRRDLSPRRIAGVNKPSRDRANPGHGKGHPGHVKGHVQVFILDKSLPSERRSNSVPPPRTNGRSTTDSLQLPRLVITSEDDQTPRPSTTIPEISGVCSDDEENGNELYFNAIDLVAMANDEHRSSSSMTRHKLVEDMIDKRNFTPRPHSVAVSERIMENKYMNLKFKRNPCLRAESILNDELSENINDLSRECCDVFGPSMCQECQKIYCRNDNLVRNESYFPSLNISTQSLSTLTLVRRHMPGYSPWQLQRMIAEGDIDELAIRRDRLADAAKDFDKRVLADFQRREKRMRGRRISAFNVPDKQTFFSSISDLRAQIEQRKKAGRWGRRQALFNLIDDEETPGHIPQEIDIEPTLPDDIDNDRLGPPIMSREEMEYQHSQPRFYAGRTFDYELPKPPPMAEIVQRATAAMSLMENTNAAKIGGLDALADNPEILAWRQARQNYEKEKREKAQKEKEQKAKLELNGIQEQSDTEESNSIDENQTTNEKAVKLVNDNQNGEVSTSDEPQESVTSSQSEDSTIITDNVLQDKPKENESQSPTNLSSRDTSSTNGIPEVRTNGGEIKTFTLSRKKGSRSRRNSVVSNVLVKPIIEEEPEVVV